MPAKFARNPSLAVNRLLAALPDPDQRLIRANGDRVELLRGTVISRPGDRLHEVYFPTESVLSLMTPPADHVGLEVRLVGNEGMIGTPLILGVEVTLLHTVVQGAGPAWRMSRERFGEALLRSDALHTRLNRYLDVLMNQGALLVACTRFHLVEARLARWLLMTQDRVHGDRFHVTHECLALRLGVRRVGITKAATALQERNLIHYRRGEITVLDRTGLRAAACGCYGAAEAMYDRLLGI
ncbi:MAG: Crp/Fnr family transcriptional regulator [Comamonadaceae bacterium]|nr:Crp/Fnr family transcriptional regulator [Comamonadaceae bacterium]